MKALHPRAIVYKHWGPRSWIVECLRLSDGLQYRSFASWAEAVEWLRREGW